MDRSGFEVVWLNDERLDGTDDVLERLLALRTEFQRKLSLDLIVGLTGETNASDRGDPFEASRDVDTIAKHIVVFHDDVAQMHAYPHRDAASLRNPAIVFG